MGNNKKVNQLVDKLKSLRSRVPGTEGMTAQPRAVHMVIVGIAFILYVFVYIPVNRLTGAAGILALVPVSLIDVFPPQHGPTGGGWAAGQRYFPGF
jgi:hypothetical protein